MGHKSVGSKGGPGGLTPLFLDQTEVQRAEKIFLRLSPPPHPYLRVWMTSTPAYLKVWMCHCMILNEVSYREARSQGLTPYPNLQSQGKAPWGQGCPYPFIIKTILDRKGTPLVYFRLTNGIPFTYLDRTLHLF